MALLNLGRVRSAAAMVASSPAEVQHAPEQPSPSACGNSAPRLGNVVCGTSAEPQHAVFGAWRSGHQLQRWFHE